MTKEQAFFGGPGDFMTVRHLTIRGTNFHIGQRIGALAQERYNVTLQRLRGNPLFARARRAFTERHYPIQWERMRGVAAAFGIDPADDRYDLTGPTYHMDVPMPAAGCSAIYYPPSSTVSGGGYLTRNYDFPIGSMADMMQVPLPHAVTDTLPPVMSEPYIMTWYPEDGGYASVAIHAFDLLAGTLDGMNSAGLVVAILADEEARNALGPHLEMHPRAQQIIGLHELQVMRFLLDTCATAEEAKIALLTIKQYYRFMPNHYIVADRAGHSFIYENSTGRNAQYVTEGDGRPQVVTNHHVYGRGAAAPAVVDALTVANNSVWRFHALQSRLAAHPESFTRDEIKASTACVNVFTLFSALSAGARLESTTAAQARTVWHCLYDQQAGAVEFSFYLGDDVKADGTREERRSEYLRVALEPAVKDAPRRPAAPVTVG